MPSPETTPPFDIGVPAAVRQLDPNGGWDNEKPGGWPDMPTYRALRRAQVMGYVERSSACGAPRWRLTHQGVQFRKQMPHPETTLSPCPFCGGTSLDIGISKMFGGWIIECLTCSAVVLPTADSREEAATAWNRRHV